MNALRRPIAPPLAALVLVLVALVPMAHRWVHHGSGPHANAVTVQSADVPCDLCAAPFAEPPAPAPTAAVVLAPDMLQAETRVFTDVVGVLEAVGRAPPTV